ncbi:MAG TPA: hypothetical protein VFR33_05395 [Candidatus Dormibacteraeota bacterium]|nr:hypothetical protein [Candidatus Dormibacteraeota bacterium]
MANTTAEKTIEEAQAAMTVKRAFGEPFQVNGLTILPAARVGGGAGGGAMGSGFGLSSRPMGVYVIDDKDAHWVPIDTPNPIVGLLTAPILAVRRLLFGPGPWEQKLSVAVGTPAAKKRPASTGRARTPKSVRHSAA